MSLLKDAREEFGFTQLELADALGEYQSFVARLESGQRRIDVIEFLKIAQILKFDPCEMIGKLSTKG